MAYDIEFGLRPGAYFYAEFLIADVNTGLPMRLAPHHQIVAHRSVGDCAWGPYIPPFVPAQPGTPTPRIPPYPIDPVVPPVASGNGFGWVLASDVTGEITQPTPGVLSVAIGATRFQPWWHLRRSLRFDFYAIPDNPDFTCLLASGTISFGDRAMPAPRIQLAAYPLYPNLPTEITVSQWLRALSAVIPNGRARLDGVVPAVPDDPNRIIYDTAQTVPLGGAYEQMAATLLGLTVAQLTTIRATAFLELA